MEVNHLYVFFEVAKAGSFSEAAKKLHISQSALSRSVALIEESEGVKLFERSKKGVALTTVGEDVFLLCEQMFQTYLNIRSVCKGIREVCKGPLRFATSDHITNDLLVNPILQFKKDYPLVTPSIYTGTPDEIVEHILKTECEFGLLFSRPLLPQIDYQVLRVEQMLLVCQPDLWKKNKKTSVSKTLKEVINNTGYISSLGALLQTRPSKVLKELFGEMPKISLETNNQEAQKRFCIEGGGVAYLSKFMVEEEIKAEKLYSIPMDDLHEFNLWVARKKGRHLSLSARTFLQFLRDNLDF